MDKELYEAVIEMDQKTINILMDCNSKLFAALKSAKQLPRIIPKGYVICPNCRHVVHEGNYCEMCAFSFPK